VSQTFLRWLAGIALACFVAQSGPLVAIAQNSYPVATNLQGSVAIVGLDGVTRNVASTRLVHSGETVLTGVDSMAAVDLADVGRVLLGPATKATTYSDGSMLSFQLATGALCVQSQQTNVSVDAGPLTVKPATSNTVFDLGRMESRTELAVYQGSVSETVNGVQAPAPVAKGSAQVVSSQGSQPADMRAVSADFSNLGCPEASIIRGALPQTGGGGGGSSAGGILGALLGIGAIVAAVSHGGSSSAGAPAPGPSGRTPTPTPTGLPTPTPLPSPSILPSILPSLTPSPSPSAVATPTPTPSAAAAASQARRTAAPITVQPTLIVTTIGETQTFTASEQSYSGAFHANSDSSLVLITSSVARGATATFSVAARGPGNATITIFDDGGNSQTLHIVVQSQASRVHSRS
jgi:phage baseplate assembly protein gpV